jgi:hypothetical protein
MTNAEQIKFAGAFITRANALGFSLSDVENLLKTAAGENPGFFGRLENFVGNTDKKFAPIYQEGAASTVKPKVPPSPILRGAPTQPSVPSGIPKSPPPLPAGNVHTPTPTAPASIPAANVSAAPIKPQVFPKINPHVGALGLIDGGLRLADTAVNHPERTEGMQPAIEAGLYGGLTGLNAFQMVRKGVTPSLKDSLKLLPHTGWQGLGRQALGHAGALGSMGLLAGGLGGDFSRAKQNWHQGNYGTAALEAGKQFVNPLLEPIKEDWREGRPVQAVMRAGEYAAPFLGPIGQTVGLGLGAANAAWDFGRNWNAARKYEQANQNNY